LRGHQPRDHQPRRLLLTYEVGGVVDITMLQITCEVGVFFCRVNVFFGEEGGRFDFMLKV